MVGGRHRIGRAEAERWLYANGKIFVVNLSRPDLPPKVLHAHDSWPLYLCGRGYNNAGSDARMARSVARLRARGIDIEIVPRPGKPHLYRLHDVVEICMSPRGRERIGPHPDLFVRKQTKQDEA